MRVSSALILLLILVLWSSCRADFDLVESTGNLEFSKDTVFLDTIFTGLSSATHTLKVYNRGNEDLVIPKIELARGESSAYRLNVNGIPGKSFADTEILAKDSIYIFIETTVDLQNTDTENFLYQDVIRFSSEGHVQEVPLVTLVKDAIFLFPEKNDQGFVETIPMGLDEEGNEIRIRGFFLKDNQLNFNSEIAYVIYGYAAVPPDKALTIAPGTRIYFHSNSGIVVSEGATLNVNGSLSENPEEMENEVIFQGDRLSSEYAEVPGQWGAIWFQEGSVNHSITHATIKNASIGIIAEGNSSEAPANLHVKNTQIYNSAANGLKGIAANVLAENLVINNSGQASLHITGGNYEFKHCTIANYWGQGFRSYPAVLIENEIPTATNVRTVGLKKAVFSNCIIYGNEKQELHFNRNEQASFNFEFRNCLIRFEKDTEPFTNEPLYDFTNEDHYREIILNKNPFFWNPRNNNLTLQADSPAIDLGNIETANEVPLDIWGISRISDPDSGAYEWRSSEK